ncbi:MAG: hypothetical protein NC828_01590 [Candidatus Omnitrophica bacterium]|nr:hypothetical protein [Candidatus Omnitrophota bacterium]
MTLNEIEEKIAIGQALSDDEKAFLINFRELAWTRHPDVNRFPRWQKILAWVAGYQYVDYKKSAKLLVPVTLERKRKLVFNRLRPFLRQALGKLTAVPYHQEVIPNTEEYDDIEAARIGDSLLEFFDDKLNLAELRRKAFIWLLLLNKFYLHVFWDESLSGVLTYRHKEEGGEETPRYFGSEKYKPIEIQGDVNIELLNPFNCRHDPLTSDPKKWRWFLFSEKVDTYELENLYGLRHGTLKDDAETIDETDFNITNEGDVDFSPQFTTNEVSSIYGRLTTYTKIFTKKAVISMAGKSILEVKPNPYGIIPVFSYEEKLVPIDDYSKNIVYNDPHIKDLIPIQREYNRQNSLLSLALERATKVKVLSPLDALINKSQVFEESGITIIDYNSRLGEPHQLRLDPIPPYTFTALERLEREFESVGSLHEASFGRLPRRASHASGALIDILIEQDDIVVDPIIRAVDRVFSKALSYALLLVQDNYIERRLIRLVGESMAGAVFYFEGADLKGNTDVRVTSQVGLPKNRTQRVQYIMELRRAGLIKDDQLTLEMLEFGQLKSLFRDTLLHERRALSENLRIRNNKLIDISVAQEMIYQYDDDNAHLKIHLRERLSPKFELYADSQKECLDLHINLHYQKLMSRTQSTPQEVSTGGPRLGQAAPGTEGSIVGR